MNYFLFERLSLWIITARIFTVRAFETSEEGTLFGIDYDQYGDTDMAGIERVKGRQEVDGAIYYWADTEHSKLAMGTEWDPNTRSHPGTIIEKFLYGESQQNTLQKLRNVVKSGQEQDEVFDPLNLCSPNPCQNDGVCTSSFLEDVYNCKCTAGFDGDHCEIDTCESNPCLNGGTCIGRPQGYVCECTEFFYGINCDNSVLSVNCPPAASIPCSIEEWYNAGPRHCSPHPNDTSLAVRQQECQEMFLDDLNVTSTDQLTADDQNKYHMVQCCFKQCNGFYCTILEP